VEAVEATEPVARRTRSWSKRRREGTAEAVEAVEATEPVARRTRSWSKRRREGTAEAVEAVEATEPVAPRARARSRSEQRREGTAEAVEGTTGDGGETGGRGAGVVGSGSPDRRRHGSAVCPPRCRNKRPRLA